jgi:hypothetical protein
VQYNRGGRWGLRGEKLREKEKEGHGQGGQCLKFAGEKVWQEDRGM